jgi:PAS domain S-box-containing protein
MDGSFNSRSELAFHLGEHVCWFYETDEEYQSVILPFIQQGLECNERVIYIFNSAVNSQLRQKFIAAIPDIQQFKDQGQFIEFTTNEIYLPDQTFRPERVIAWVKSIVEQSLQAGYNGARVTGEMTWVLECMPGSERLAEYESFINDIFGEKRLLGLCQYRTSLFNPTELLNILNAHPYVIIGKKIFENVYYTPPEDYLTPNRDQAIFQNHLNNLKIMARKNEQLAEKNRRLKERSSEKLKESKARLSETQKLAHMGSFELNCRTGNLVFSDELNYLFEGRFDHREISPSEVIHSIHPDDWDRVRQTIQKARESEEPFQVEFRVILPSGDFRFLQMTIKTNVHPEKHNKCILGTILDITSIKKASQALEESERKYRNLIEQSIDAIVMTDEYGRVNEWNQGAEKIFGIQQGQVLGQNLWDVQNRAVVDESNRAQALIRQRSIVQQMLRGEEITLRGNPFQFPIRRPDGSIRTIQSIIYSIATDKGYIACSISRDFTEEYLVKSVLQDREERYRILSELTSDCAYSLRVNADGENEVEWITDSFWKILGWPPQEMIKPGDFPKIVFPADRLRYQQHNDRLLNGHTSICEFRIITKDGEARWIKDLRKPVWDKDAERVTKVYGAITDITKRKKAEDTILESENKFRMLFETMANGVIYRDANWKILSANPAALQILGRTLDSLQSMSYYDHQHPLIHEDGTPVPEKKHPAMIALHTGKKVRRMVLGIYNPNEDRYRWVLVNAMPLYRPDVKQPVQVYTTFEDITDIKEANQALLESENRFRTLIEKAPLAIGINRNGYTLYANAKHLELFGYDSLDEIKDTSILNQVAPPYHEEIKARIERKLRGLPNDDYVESTGLRRDGSQFLFRAAVTEVNLLDGPATVAFFWDITKQTQSENALRETNRVLQAIVTGSPLAIIGFDLKRRITLWTPSAEALYGWKAEEVIGRKLCMVPAFLEDEFDQMIHNSTAGKPYSYFETKIIRKDGAFIPVSISTSALYDSRGQVNGIMAIIVDIQQRKLAEAQLEKSISQLHALSARLVTIREEERTRIAREIHDELGQELTSLKMDLFWIKNRLQKKAVNNETQPMIQKISGMLTLIDETINTIRQIATELRPSILDTLGLIPAIDWLAKDFQNRSGIDCLFETHLNDPAIAPAVSTALFRICQEALTNVARHADATSVVISLAVTGDFIELSIQDNGKGILPEMIDDARSLGLLGMKERAYILGGTLTIENVPTGGTHVITQIPYYE